MGKQNQPAPQTVNPPATHPINPALLDNGLYPGFDRYREDEPGIREWARRGVMTQPDQGEGTAPAIPPSLLRGGADADRRGELPDPQWMREYMRAKYLDMAKI